MSSGSALGTGPVNASRREKSARRAGEREGKRVTEREGEGEPRVAKKAQRRPREIEGSSL